MLTDIEVTQLLCQHFSNKGSNVKITSDSGRKEYVLVVNTKKHVLFIVAKGTTGFRKNSKIKGRPYDATQIANHVGRAIISLLKIVDTKPEGKRTKAAFAFPDVPSYKKIIEKIYFPLHKLGVAFFSVSEETITELGVLHKQKA